MAGSEIGWRAGGCARDMVSYYEARAGEYDETTYELARDDPRTARDLADLERFVRSLDPGRVLEVGCGTGWLTRLLRGEIVAIDPSESMLRLARGRVADALFIRTAAPPLPFLDRSFDRLFTSHVYSHLESSRLRRWFLEEARRVAEELVVVELPWRPGLSREAWERRTLRDGTVYSVYKRYLSAAELAEEIGGEVVLDTPTYVAVRGPR